MKKVFPQKSNYFQRNSIFLFKEYIIKKKKVLIKRQVINNLLYTSKEQKNKEITHNKKKENWKSINFPTHIIFRFTAINPHSLLNTQKNLYKLLL